MPTIYKYLGIFFSFWSNEHNPIHVHVEYQGMKCKVLFYSDGRIEINNYLFANNMDTQTLKKSRKIRKEISGQNKEEMGGLSDIR
jgi:hypothetical protein